MRESDQGHATLRISSSGNLETVLLYLVIYIEVENVIIELIRFFKQKYVCLVSNIAAEWNI